MGRYIPGQGPGLHSRLTNVWLGKGIAASLLREAGEHAPLETGGVLLGWRSAEHICVTNVIGPGPSALRDKTSFVPDAEWQSEQIARLYSDSGRRLAYLGDWHTHPGASPTPSARDRQTLCTIARHPAARCPLPIMLIMGQPNTDQWIAAAHAITEGSIYGTIQVQELSLLINEALWGFS